MEHIRNRRRESSRRRSNSASGLVGRCQETRAASCGLHAQGRVTAALDESNKEAESVSSGTSSRTFERDEGPGVSERTGPKQRWRRNR
ncbi:hypothetical protein F2P81_011077 [Scophthalmus maximus]|uniref:Uncharacterized protein n=1 Tax=Scophthalmus maximus TaxID=52904 RepID=A0A6A4SSY6_SCOMX|nr:hypothetical protein F2P81_011077 [Scophthalmus maximus]